MSDEDVRKALAAAIFVALVVILATPFFIRKQSAPAFTDTPRLRLSYLDNRTVFDVQSELGDTYYKKVDARVHWDNGTGIAHYNRTAENTYILCGELSGASINLTVLYNLTVRAEDSHGREYGFTGDVNITKFMLKTRFCVFMNITEYREGADHPRLSTVELSGMPYRTTLELSREAGGG
jgi:hypothetical protein